MIFLIARTKIMAKTTPDDIITALHLPLFGSTTYSVHSDTFFSRHSIIDPLNMISYNIISKNGKILVAVNFKYLLKISIFLGGDYLV